MKATADNETPIPGYLLPEISSILFVEPACSEGEIFTKTVYGDYVCVCVCGCAFMCPSEFGRTVTSNLLIDFKIIWHNNCCSLQ